MDAKSTVTTLAGLLTLGSTVAMAGTLASERDLENMIKKSVEQQQAADSSKYNKVVALAGDKQGQLAAKNDAVTSAYNKWRELKAKADTTADDSIKYQAVQAGEQYAQANQEFIDMQKEILVNTADSANLIAAINALNETAPSAAGR
jgi:hypothetical protein